MGEEINAVFSLYLISSQMGILDSTEGQIRVRGTDPNIDAHHTNVCFGDKFFRVVLILRKMQAPFPNS